MAFQSKLPSGDFCPDAAGVIAQQGDGSINQCDRLVAVRGVGPPGNERLLVLPRARPVYKYKNIGDYSVQRGGVLAEWCPIECVREGDQ